MRPRTYLILLLVLCLPALYAQNTTDLGIDFTDLTDGAVAASWYNNNESHNGVRDYGPDNPNSLHTVHIDTSERDMHVPLLRTIPQGHSKSVRLGSQQGANFSQSLTYTLDIPENSNMVLIVRYAAVQTMPYPIHSPSSSNPSLFLYITNMSGASIDRECNYKVCYGDTAATEGWQLYGGTANTDRLIWRDWEPVGVQPCAVCRAEDKVQGACPRVRMVRAYVIRLLHHGVRGAQDNRNGMRDGSRHTHSSGGVRL